ncbi:MAG: hypothetical protein K2X27_22215 [Candidatus Obscuribacterales bacterium]|nr:hypothetical protein [Candidatus Obscuribacterales bacterium]
METLGLPKTVSFNVSEKDIELGKKSDTLTRVDLDAGLSLAFGGFIESPLQVTGVGISGDHEYNMRGATTAMFKRGLGYIRVPVVDRGGIGGNPSTKFAYAHEGFKDVHLFTSADGGVVINAGGSN